MTSWLGEAAPARSLPVCCHLNSPAGRCISGQKQCVSKKDQRLLQVQLQVLVLQQPPSLFRSFLPFLELIASLCPQVPSFATDLFQFPLEAAVCSLIE